MLFQLSNLLFLIPLLHYGEGCGTSTHISIAHEAATFYKGPADSTVDYASIIRKHSDAFVAGNPYPDAMYPSLCFGGKYHDAAEDTHWAPFLNASVNYIREKYPQPWDEDTEKLVAFIFGFVSHQVADITWHSLAGFEQGFLQAMANVNFHGVFDKAHSDGDVGGDMLTQFDKSDRIVGITKWYVPVDDLYEIYKEFYKGNRTIPKYVIEMCSELLYVEYILETFAGAEIFKPFVKKSPFMLAQLDNYFLGGIHDMAAWTSKIWNETAFMLKHGTSKCNMERSTIHVNCTGYLKPDKAQSALGKKNPGRMYPLQTGGWNISHVERRRGRRGVFLVPGKEMKDALQGEIERRKKKQDELTTTKYSYSQIGKSISNMYIGFDKRYVGISAPTYSENGLPSLGKVWVIPVEKLETCGEELYDLDSLASMELKGKERMSRFGWSIQSARFSRSSIFQDLLISAPTTGAEGLQYKGAIYVYKGTKDSLSPKPNITLTVDDKQSPPQHAHTNYGYTLSSRAYSVIASSPFFSNQRGMEYFPEFGQVYSSGVQNFSWYGYSHSTIFLNVPQTYISYDLDVVGSPNYRICHFSNCTYDERDKQAYGQIHYFVDRRLSFQLTGTEEFEEYGYDVSIGANGRYLAVGSPGKNVVTKIDGVPITFRQAGKVTLYYFHSKFMTDTPEKIAEFVGDRAYGRFGEHVRLEDVDGDFNDELIVSAPRRTDDITEELYGGEEGAVYIYKINTSSPFGTVTTDKAFKSFIGKEHYARFGDSFEVVKSNVGIRLLVGATTSSKYGFKTGLVHNIPLHKYTNKVVEYEV